MKLDNDLLRKMIDETLGVVMEDLTEQEDSNKEIAAATEKAAAEEAQAVNAKATVADLKAKKAKEDAAKAEQEAGGTMEESFQLTKGRLRQIIAEEMKKAKEQGLL